MHETQVQQEPKSVFEYDLVEPGMPEYQVIQQETELLAMVQKQLARQQIEVLASDEYDRDLIALRDQISEANLEDVAPLVAEMYRLQALGSRSGNGRALPVDVNSPYFGHLRLEDERGTRDVLVGNRGHVKTGEGFAIVDWRNAPVSKIYYRYDEGDDFEESFGGRVSSGLVKMRRTITITSGELKRITWPEGSVARKKDGVWVRLTRGERPTLRGGAGIASRPPAANTRRKAFKPGKLGVVGDESLREDKRLQAITALIDKKQFELITKADSGIVILQGGAGSGKTTVALHRAAYLYFQNPQVFSPRKMAVVVRSPALVEYISRILPSLEIEGIKVVSLEGFMRESRQRALPQLKRKIVDEIPPEVARLKKHPAILGLLERAVKEEGEATGDDLRSVLEDVSASLASAFDKKWRATAKLALLPRFREIGKWIESGAATRAGVTAKVRGACMGIVRRARSDGADVLSTWAQVLTDSAMLREAIEARSPGQVSPAEIKTLIRWVALQAEEEEPAQEDEDEDPRSRSRRRKVTQEAVRALGPKGRERIGEEGLERREAEDGDRGLGIDGRQIDEDSPVGRFDEHDDALLLRIAQLKHGGLPIPNSQKTVVYEHIVVDEAQDLSPTDISVLRGMLSKRESMTLAGDTAQKLVFDNGFDDWKGLVQDLGISGVELEPLRISYRSTKEVVQFSRHVLGPYADPIEPEAPRSGAAVEQFNFGTTGEAVAFLAEALRSLVIRERRASVAVITRYRAQADLYAEQLRRAEVPAVRRVYGKEFSFAPGIDVVDVAQIKGLEYDYVVLAEANAATYSDSVEARHLMHIAATRAVYQLWVTSVGAPSPLLPPDLI